MKLDKVTYKKALSKIKKPDKTENSERLENQRYKENVMNGRHPDTFAGWDDSNAFFDRDMIRRENHDSMLFLIPFMVVGVILLVIAGKITFDNCNYRINGTKVELTYTENFKYKVSDINKNSYDYYTGYVYMEKGEDDIYHKESKMIGFNSYYGFGTSVTVNLVYYDEAVKNINTVGTSGDKIYYKYAEYGFYPDEEYLTLPPSLQFYYEQNKGEYVNVYYLENEGETFFDAHLILKWWIILIMDMVVIAWNVFFIRKFILLFVENRRLKR